ncbi:TraR/DksA C4-type zinc finger protein [Streptomyces sp. NBC_00414]|uniref:TraR/DksA family transcriptional regulator n=1 Tax=Streptomyces sp. NBC_00414 TaxID=2975739 RepID=UPI002E21E4EF
MSVEDLAALRENLHEQRLFRREQLQHLSASATPRTDAPRTDASRDRRATPQAEVRGKLAASARMVLADVEAALIRMDEGSYGICHLCREPIDRERLTVVPQCRFCTPCQQVKEGGR